VPARTPAQPSSEAPSTLALVSESPQPASPLGARAGEEEQIDALPVLAGESRIVRAQPLAGALPGERRAAMPAVQAAAVAAGGFVAGAAVVGLVHRRHRRSAKLVGRGRGRGVGSGAGRKTGRVAELVEIVGSRSLLVDVHLLGGPGER
jgi:hypothetical protein